VAHPDEIPPKDYLKQLPSPYEEAEKVVADKMGRALERASSARQADEMAADIVGEVSGDFGFSVDGDEFDGLLTVATNMASQAFPGNWEDYPWQ
jgi:hypothetical protein